MATEKSTVVHTVTKERHLGRVAQGHKLAALMKKPRKHRKEIVLPADGLYRYLLKPGEEHRDEKSRATDMIWSWNTFRLDRIIENPGQRVIYHLQHGPERAFVKEELMLIPEDTQLPPEWVKDW